MFASRYFCARYFAPRYFPKESSFSESVTRFVGFIVNVSKLMSR